MSFHDHARIMLVSGKGGDGHISFRREKYVAAGGPDGGDGGNGGSIIFEVEDGMHTLSSFRHKYKFTAGNGEDGGKKRCHGKNGSDMILKVPEGTVILDAKTEKVIADLSGDNRRVVVLRGGRGGKGNMNYATPTMQVPKYAQPGGDARELEVRLELKLIADVGLVGFPNAGKSTFLSKVSNARPKIADYPFTTLVPQLGVVDLDDENGFVIADIPGLIEGAAEGAGLGHEFLRHIERTRLLLHIVDVSGLNGRDPVEDVQTINKELVQYKADLEKRPQILAANKTDLIFPEEGKEDPAERLRKIYEPLGVPVFPISAATGAGVRELLYGILKKLEELPEEPVVFRQEYDPMQDEAEDHLPYTVERSEDDKNTFIVEGPRIERMLGYTNLDSEKGFRFFQRFLKENGILDELEAAGIREGDTVRMYGLAFDYYPDKEKDEEQ
ncbi:MAG: GTPase ObgE [Eubacterium sp.]|nr:GTPase ObgE [Eubacterium sp.]